MPGLLHRSSSIALAKCHVVVGTQCLHGTCALAISVCTSAVSVSPSLCPLLAMYHVWDRLEERHDRQSPQPPKSCVNSLRGLCSLYPHPVHRDTGLIPSTLLDLECWALSLAISPLSWECLFYSCVRVCILPASVKSESSDVSLTTWPSFTSPSCWLELGVGTRVTCPTNFTRQRPASKTLRSTE